jgi:type VI protein secretion system component Hcp
MILMNIDGIEGNSEITEHDKWIIVDSLEWSVGRNILSGTGQTKDRAPDVATAKDIVVKKQMDSAAAKLFETACGTEGKKVEIHFLSGAGKAVNVYSKWTLENALISNYSVDGTSDTAVETVNLNFTKLTVESTVKGADDALGSPYPVTFNRGTGVLE